METRSSASGKEYGAPFLGVFFVLFFGTKNTPDPLVRRVANILNKQHSSDDCFQPPDHLLKKQWFFILITKGTGEK
ncbi:MAG: hypothetical protein J6S12_01570 [Alphaproteobacteria bacterium]|nr:hypothetical protein [Alphaproteobacteria bacterium]